MSRLESAHTIETVVEAPRHPTAHLARAVSAEQRVYLLHPDACVADHGVDLRACEYSQALDEGIDVEIWGDFEDQSVIVLIDADHFDLIPIEYTPTAPPEGS